MVVLARVDQRLIHGLIVNQWAPHLQVKRFVVVDDVLCNNEEIKGVPIVIQYVPTDAEEAY